MFFRQKRDCNFYANTQFSRHDRDSTFLHKFTRQNAIQHFPAKMRFNTFPHKKMKFHGSHQNVISHFLDKYTFSRQTRNSVFSCQKRDYVIFHKT